MKRSSIRSPYLWAIVAIATVIVIAWVGRENYRPVITGTAAPEFKALTLDGSETTLSDFRDKVLLLNIWATWCVPCLTEMPSMQRLHEALEGEDFEVLAVSIDASLGDTDNAGRPGGDL
ncbi:uncharacterized protein METZ01_LOCUS261488, partial [marine metagenome]